jgi:NADP-dependent aldehyde dehydrogenase
MTAEMQASSTWLVEDQVAAAANAAPAALASSRAQRAGWLTRVALRLDDARDELVALGDSETHLGAERLRGEVTRTTDQLRMFADVLQEGSYLEASVDVAGTIGGDGSQEIRRFLRPIGAVAVFSASNFPFAFSVAGGDTASALAAGCPVVVKAHSGHARLSRRTAEVVSQALDEVGAPSGIFGLVEGRAAGLALAAAPPIRAVAFTGSLPGAEALMSAMSERDEPIPFFGELGSVNPVVITPGAALARAQELAAELVGSFTLGGGQFCTKPGLVFVPSASAFAQAVGQKVGSMPGMALLTERIAESFDAAAGRLRAAGDVRALAHGVAEDGDMRVPVVLTTTIDNFLEHSDELLQEAFGPLTLLVEYRALDEVITALARVGGSLTATAHSEPEEDIDGLVTLLAERSGRVVFDGWPTGVSVTWGQHHGGPWPATTSQHTSVGATAIRRFLRPIAYQGAPAHVLPVDLTDAGLARLPHRRDGRWASA